MSSPNLENSAKGLADLFEAADREMAYTIFRIMGLLLMAIPCPLSGLKLASKSLVTRQPR